MTMTTPDLPFNVGDIVELEIPSRTVLQLLALITDITYTNVDYGDDDYCVSCGKCYAIIDGELNEFKLYYYPPRQAAVERGGPPEFRHWWVWFSDEQHAYQKYAESPSWDGLGVFIKQVLPA